MKAVANLIHVSNIQLALDWYKRAFAQAVERTVEGFVILDVNGFSIEIVNEDEKVRSGKYGSVTYWQVDDLGAEISRFKSLGSTVYRGPLEIEGGISMCQVTDPFGNLIGLRGPLSSPEIRIHNASNR